MNEELIPKTINVMLFLLIIVMVSGVVQHVYLTDIELIPLTGFTTCNKFSLYSSGFIIYHDSLNGISHSEFSSGMHCVLTGGSL